MALGWEYLKRVGVPDVVLTLNSLGDASTRPAYLEALKKHFEPMASSFTDDSRLTFERNTMRLLDSKEEALKDAIASAPAIVDFLDDASKKHFDDVQRLLGKLGIPFTLDRRLVRGLDYYTRTAFEFVYAPKGENALNRAGTVCGGGRYDRLVHELGGPDKPAVGFAMGLDRLVMLLEALTPSVAIGPLLYLGTFEGPLRDEAVALTMRLRNHGFRVDFGATGKLGKQAERADKLGARWFATYGQSEHESGKITLKNLRLPDGDPAKETAVAMSSLAEWLTQNSPTPGAS
jgi:histidyl-tRNA synthetase